MSLNFYGNYLLGKNLIVQNDPHINKNQLAF